MGIKDLYKVIEKHAPEAIGRVPITFFEGKKVAIDGHGWIYKNMYGARNISAKKTNFAIDKVDNKLTRQEWIKICLNFITKWLRYGVLPIFVFDGDDKPEKGETQRKRSEATQAKKDAFKETVRQMNELDILDRTPEMIAEVQDQFAKFIDMSHEEIDNLITVLDVVGLPWLQAKGEAEQLCTMLVHDGLVDAVFSKDGDNLALGCPVLLKDYGTDMFENGRSIPTFEYYQLDTILEKLEMNMDEFVDLCILLECDYNTRIRGWGPVAAVKLMKEHRSIDQIAAATGKDITCLNYQNCLTNFKRVDSKSITRGGRMDMKEPDIFAIRDILEVNGVSILTNNVCASMAECYHQFNSQAPTSVQPGETQPSSSSSGDPKKTRIIKIQKKPVNTKAVRVVKIIRKNKESANGETSNGEPSSLEGEPAPK